MLRKLAIVSLAAVIGCGGVLSGSQDDDLKGKPAVCGNGILEAGEQCDDGNTANLDGCDSHCHLEENLRANALVIQFGTDSFCTANALGGAIGSRAQQGVQTELSANVASGLLTLGFAALGLTDLTGAKAQSFKLGAITGTPFNAPPLHHYDGTRDLDWWYHVRATDLDAHRVPLAQLPASIGAGALLAGPGKMEIALVMGGGLARLSGSGVRLRATLGPATAPTATRVATPGHLPGEHLAAALTSIGSLTAGELCANFSADSLARTPAPPALRSGGAEACDEGYGASNTLLDVFVGGCTKGGFVSILSATQPDQTVAGAATAGAGGPYQLSGSSTQVTSCADRGGNSVDLAACLKAAAFSGALKFTANRVIFK
jgi:cysteine-rich repeat protein